jgi:predicted Zn finger-like uncharacterized protein
MMIPMRIVCPSCDATYDVPASRLKPGKMVRCARCGSDWLPEAEPEAATEEAPSEPPAPPPAPEPGEFVEPLPEITAMDRLAASPARPPSRAGLIAAWVLTFVVLAGAAAATFGWRNAVVQAWPPSGRILAAAGRTAPMPAVTTAPPVQTAAKKAE